MRRAAGEGMIYPSWNDPTLSLVRLRAGRRFYADPEGPPARTGRPRRHGPKFDCKDPKSWPKPTREHLCKNDHYARCAFAPGRSCTPKCAGTRAVEAVNRYPTFGARLCWWKWGVCGVASGDAGRKSFGFGGTVPENRTSTISGERTLGASIWSTPSASSSRLWDGPSLRCATPSRPTAGVG
jgi:hypothetical protein